MRPEIKNELDERANGCRIGLLAVTNVTNPKTSEALEKAKSLLEEELRGKYAQIERQELRSLHPMSVTSPIIKNSDIHTTFSNRSSPLQKERSP